MLLDKLFPLRYTGESMQFILQKIPVTACSPTSLHRTFSSFVSGGPSLWEQWVFGSSYPRARQRSGPQAACSNNPTTGQGYIEASDPSIRIIADHQGESPGHALITLGRIQGDYSITQAEYNPSDSRGTLRASH